MEHSFNTNNTDVREGCVRKLRKEYEKRSADCTKCPLPHGTATRRRGGSVTFCGNGCTTVKTRPTMQKQAEDFLELLLKEDQITEVQYTTRIKEIKQEIRATGTYTQTKEEIAYGVKVSWRNVIRSNHRIYWSSFETLDCRHLTKAKEIFDAICVHLKTAFNGGDIKCITSVFAPASSPVGQRKEGDFAPVILNDTLIGYAGYKENGGEVLGDPKNVEFTKILQRRFGWKTGYYDFKTAYDVLPIVIQTHVGKTPEMFVLPEDIVPKVSISHPRHAWLRYLNINWYPMVTTSNLSLEIGGLTYQTAPFNQWQVLDVLLNYLLDSERYNLLPVLARYMRIDRKKDPLWEEEICLTLNRAILYSYQQAGVRIDLPYDISEKYLNWYSNELKYRGYCPGNRCARVPPFQASMGRAYRKEPLMQEYTLYPNWTLQRTSWKKTMKSMSIHTAVRAIQFVGKILRFARNTRTRLLIVYATSTSTAAKYAFIAFFLLRHAFDCKIIDVKALGSLRKDSKKFDITLYFVSTFGTGEPAFSAREFVKYLSNAQGQPLKGRSFAMLGLGNSSYKFFCRGAKKVEELLLKCGATELFDRVNADELGDQMGMLHVFLRKFIDCAAERNWIGSYRHHEISIEMNKYGVLCDFELSYDLMCDANYIRGQKISTNEEERHSAYPLQLTQNLCLDQQQHLDGNIIASIISIEELIKPEGNTRTGEDRSTVLVKFNIKDAPEKYNNRRYQAGDHLVVYAMNDQELVASIAKYVGVDDIDKPFTYVKDGMPLTEDEADLVPFPLPITFRYALSAYFDITSPPTKKIFSAFAQFAQDPEERKHLETVAQEHQTYLECLQQHYPTLLTIFQQFKSLKLSVLDFFAKIVPELLSLRGRSYSISSSSLVTPTECHLTMSLHKWAPSPTEERLGLTTGYITSLNPGSQVRVHIREAAATHLPDDNSCPIVLIGAGSGIAPLRSYWQAREHTNSRCRDELEKKQIGDAVLFYGCRNEHDYLYEDEINKALKHGVLKDAKVAFSRQKEHPKKYVHQLILDNPEMITDLIMTNKCYIFVCGAERMGVGVIKAFRKVCRNHSERCSNIFGQMTKDGRYAEDVFTETSLVGENIGAIEISKDETHSIHAKKVHTQDSEMRFVKPLLKTIEIEGNVNVMLEDDTKTPPTPCRVRTPLATDIPLIRCNLCIRAGMLLRLQGGLSSHKYWKRLFVRIAGDRINYYENEDDEIQKGCIKIADIAEVIRPSTADKANQLTIVMKQAVREIYFRAETKELSDRWIYSLREKLKTPLHFTFSTVYE